MNEYECTTCINTEDADERAERGVGSVADRGREREGAGKRARENASEVNKE